MYQTISVEKLDNPSQYKWFRTFANPCYGMNVKVDVGEVPEMRMREVRGEIRLYDVINPTFTVMTDSGKFANAGFKMIEDYKGFYEQTRKIIDEKKAQTEFDDEYNDSSDYDDYYITCLPWLSIESFTHPLPDNNIESSSCPRIAWKTANTLWF